jgi:hypothetical protein
MAEPPRRFPLPWHADPMPGGYVVRDANGQALAYLYSRDNDAEARQAKVLTKDEARRIAVNLARLRVPAVRCKLVPSPTARHIEHRARVEGAGVRAKPYDHCGDLLCIAKLPQWARRDHCIDGLVPKVTDHSRIDGAWCHAVHPDVCVGNLA